MSVRITLDIKEVKFVFCVHINERDLLASTRQRRFSFSDALTASLFVPDSLFQKLLKPPKKIKMCSTARIAFKIKKEIMYLIYLLVLLLTAAASTHGE